MNKFYGNITIFLLIMFGYNTVYTDTKSEFYSDDTSYSYSLTIRTDLNCFDLSMLLFDRKTLRHFNNFVDSIHISSIDSLSHIAEIHFRMWFYKGTSRYRRVLCPAESLTIDLMKFEHNWTVIPQLKKATIRYFFDSNENGCTVRYLQSVTVSRKIRSVYRKMIKLQLNNFAKTLENYIRTAGNTKSKK